MVEIVERVEDFIIEGFLFSNSNRYQIIRGIPRFVRGEESAYVNSFGYQWQKWPFIQFEGNNLGKPLEGHTSKMFEKITSWQKEDLKNITNELKTLATTMDIPVITAHQNGGNHFTRMVENFINCWKLLRGQSAANTYIYISKVQRLECKLVDIQV